MDDILLGLGANHERQVLRLARANRHGLSPARPAPARR